ncbi:MAG: ABC transporter permease [Steroidobacteraceae bacterium]
MNGFLYSLQISLKLYFRNRMAMLYGYLFPLLFLLAFRVLYRYEAEPLLNHVGQLLTIGILGGACFGLPTTLVSERERGVWRRYQLMAQRQRMLISNLVARYCILISAVLLQLLCAMALGMPLPMHPLALCIAFTVASFTFLGVGLVVAALADTVPAVQALGQCLFLPMLILGGVAVPVSALPEWTRQFALYLPGIYSVAALQQAMMGALAGKELLALLLTGCCSGAVGVLLFRWDSQQQFRYLPRKGWLALALLCWVATGWYFQSHREASAALVAIRSVNTDVEPWRQVDLNDIDAQIDFTQLPPDNGIVTPIAAADQLPEGEIINSLNRIASGLDQWAPALEVDRLQRVRNYLLLIGTLDVLQQPTEAFAPSIVFTRMQQEMSSQDLQKILFWIATHVQEGSVAGLDQLASLGITGHADVVETRSRAALYAVKFLARLRGTTAAARACDSQGSCVAE